MKARALFALLLIAALTASAAPIVAAQAEGKAQPAASVSVKVVDLNTASADELATVPGIGPALAQRIIEFREKEGRFQRVEDLMKVKGIGEKSFQKLRPHFKVEAKG
jgi:competence protein ComEA